MPELNEVLDKKVDGVVEVTTIDCEISETVETETEKKKPVSEKKPTEKKPIKKTEKKVTKTVEAAVETVETKEEETTEPVTETEKKPKTKKVAKSESDEDKKTLRRPPMEQLTKDFENHIKTLSIDGNQLKKLEYKCGKVIYGLQNEDGKDFRVIAFKARKKSKSVAGKSRCIFYFGVSKELPALTKKYPGTSTTEFGKCSVQVKKPIQLILDKTTFAEQFGQDVEKVMSTLKSLAEATIEQKTEQWMAFQEKVAAKKQATTDKKESTKSKKNAAGDE